MKTYQELEKAIQEGRTGDFLLSAVHDHQGSQAYRDAADGMAYYHKHNATIEKYQKFLYTVTGRKVPDTFSADYRLKTLIFRRLVVQLSSYILANGVQMDGKERLGKDFDNKLMTAAKMALAQGVAYGYWNNDHLEIFTLADAPDCPGFVPLKDEDTSELKAGIRYWFRPVGNDTIFRATLYMEDGISEWSGKNGKDIVEQERRGYKRHTLRSDAMGVIDQCDENYSRLPMSRASAIRTARTAVTGAQNAGRMDSYKAAEGMGIKLQKQWLSTLDNRTRHAHAMLDGQTVDTDKPFKVDGYELMYPGDRSAPGYLLYNCRCTTIAVLPDVDTSDAERWSIDPETGERKLVSDMSYQEWAGWKEKEQKTVAKFVQSGKIKLPDIQIGKSVGAKSKNYNISLPNKEIVHLTEGSRVTNVTVIAGKGRNREIDELPILIERYPGSSEHEWQKAKGLGYIDYNGESYKAELHWYQEPSVGRVEWKVKPDADGNWFIEED